MSAQLQSRLRNAVTEGRAAPLELALADWALRHGASAPVAVALAATARAVAEGHSCLSLEHAPPCIAGETPFCKHSELEKALQDSPLVGAPFESKPLILDAGKLYLQRYWAYETRLAARLRQLLAGKPAEVDIDALVKDAGLFDYAWVGPQETHWQAVAAFTALRHRFALISGGPGTGKTYTVLRLIRLLIEAAFKANAAPPLIRMAAPTGKAAARMVESTQTGLAEMDVSEAVRSHIPAEAKTLHRLIGMGFNTTLPKHNPDNPLTADVVIVDEASMVDLPMMAKLVEALSPNARLILLGDRYQLASVESGSVLAELCNAAGVNEFTPQQQHAAGTLLRGEMPAGNNPLADHVVTLQTSHRFHVDSPIGQLAAAVNAGDAEQAIAIANNNAPDIEWLANPGADRLDSLIQTATHHYATLVTAETPKVALNRLKQKCLLCALRHGPSGSVTLNRKITEQLALRHGLDPNQHWYHGRPIIVTRNDYRAGLFNGDTGVCARDENGQLRVWFETGDGLRAFLPTALPEHDTVYAMTVHKSQGSEFDHVTLVLPLEDSPVLSRELLYTGITRAKLTVTIAAAETVMRNAIERRITRFSNLAARLHEPLEDV